jgi:hypothetical protein
MAGWSEGDGWFWGGERWFPFCSASIESVWGTCKNHMEAALPRLSMSFPRHGQSIDRIDPLYPMRSGAKASTPSRASSGFATPPSPPSTHENARQLQSRQCIRFRRELHTEVPSRQLRFVLACALLSIRCKPHSSQKTMTCRSATNCFSQHPKG